MGWVAVLSGIVREMGPHKPGRDHKRDLKGIKGREDVQRCSPAGGGKRMTWGALGKKKGEKPPPLEKKKNPSKLHQ